jgi:hypothetical protein
MKNVYLRTVSLKNRKSCPTCKIKLEENESIYSSGEYIHAKWRNIEHFCKNCFNDFNEKLIRCSVYNFEYKSYQGCELPCWITG